MQPTDTKKLLEWIEGEISDWTIKNGYLALIALKDLRYKIKSGDLAVTPPSGEGLLEIFNATFPPNCDGWWCPQCKNRVDATYHECCATCGTYIGDKQPDIAGIENLRAAIAHHSQTAEGGWIPCSERLPTQTGHYLTAHKGNGTCVDYWHGDRWGEFFAGEITDWAHLPPAPIQPEEK